MVDRSRWVLRMAWRDIRGSWRRLAPFGISLVIGLGAVLALLAFGLDLERTLDERSRALLGADVALRAQAPLPDSLLAELRARGEVVERRSFETMAYFPSSDNARLVTVRGLSGPFPLAGDIVTRPVSAAQSYLEQGEALVDARLLSSGEVEVGEAIRIGGRELRIAGAIERLSTSADIRTAFTPRVMLPMSAIDSSLFGRGSRVRYEWYVDTGGEEAATSAAAALAEGVEDVQAETAAGERSDWEEGLGNMYRFLGLVGYLALLLGAIGVASIMQQHIRSRRDTLAVLRCLGASRRRSVAVLLAQALLLGTAAGTLGIAVGALIQWQLPAVLESFLPVDLTSRFHPSVAAVGMLMGTGIALLAAMWPLVGVYYVSPLEALSGREGTQPGSRLWRTLIVVMGSGLLLLGAVAQAPDTLSGLAYGAGVVTIGALLLAAGSGLRRLARRLVARVRSFSVRQGVANLYRPQNQTSIVVLSVGLGVFIVVSMLLVKESLLREVEVSGERGPANVILFDVMPEQVAQVTAFLRENDYPVVDSVEIVPMQLSSIRGRSVDEVLQDSTREAERWALERNYRSTYRGTLSETEEVTEGEWIGRVDPGTRPIPVSAESDIAGDLGIELGDELQFDIQGVKLDVYVASIRRVDWKQVGTNFFFVFPEGVLERAPQTAVVLTAASNQEASGRLQAKVARAFPGIAVIDIHRIVEIARELFDQFGAVLRFMAYFCLLVGVFVVGGVLLAGQEQRQREMALLKTLGAKRRTVRRVLWSEFTALAALSTLAGLLPALAAAWALLRWVFETPIVLPLSLVPAAFLLVCGGTLLIGALVTQRTYDRSALDVLRVEGDHA